MFTADVRQSISFLSPLKAWKETPRASPLYEFKIVFLFNLNWNGAIFSTWILMLENHWMVWMDINIHIHIKWIPRRTRNLTDFV